jgi:hypothetical protein
LEINYVGADVGARVGFGEMVGKLGAVGLAVGAEVEGGEPKYEHKR